jgi:hypothetical protein
MMVPYFEDLLCAVSAFSASRRLMNSYKQTHYRGAEYAELTQRVETGQSGRFLLPTHNQYNLRHRFL